MILFDTNVLVYAINEDAPQHAASRAIIQAAFDGRVAGVLVPQVLLEFFAVVTHPRRMAYPLDSNRAWEQISALQARLPVLEIGPLALATLGDLVASRRPTGGDIFDLFLVAQMRVYGVDTICTYNGGDFTGVGVEALSPEEVLARHGLSGQFGDAP